MLQVNVQSFVLLNAIDNDCGCTCLGYLGGYNTSRFTSVCVASPKEAKARPTIVTVDKLYHHCCDHFCGVITAFVQCILTLKVKI